MVTIRRGVPADLPRCRAIWLATEHVDAPAADTVLPLHAHELETGDLLVAEEAGAVVGFGATLTRSGVTYLADLFVRPDRQGRGVGQALLHALLDDRSGPRFTMASGSHAARALYARFGMEPAWELSYLVGDARDLDVDALGAMGDGLTLTHSTPAAVAALDASVTGRDRQPELVHETTRLGGELFAVQRGARTIGHAVVIQPTWWVPWRPHGTRVAPIVVADATDAIAAVAATVCRAVAHGATVLNTSVPVPHPAHAPLLTAGFRRVDADLHMTSNAALVDPTRYVPSVDTV